MSEPILSIKNANKSFYGVQVLFDVTLDLMEGELLGVVGENGAGKSTLMNIIGGVLPADSGSMELYGKPYTPQSPRDATAAGIAFIHQELSLFSNLTVAENVFIDNFPRNAFGAVDKKAIQSRTKEMLAEYNLELSNPNEKIENLPMGLRQMIEVMKALAKDVKVLIFDEPTTSLSNREKDILFDTIGHLKEQGISIIYISHILEDVQLLSDRISILRDGHVVDTRKKEDLSKDEMIKLMVGRDLNQVYPTIEKEIKEPLFSINNVDCAGFVKNCSIDVRAGEIVGLFGLMGAGRSELMRAAFGVDPMAKGSITVKGEQLDKPTPQACIDRNMAFITENRREEGLMMPKTVNENLILVELKDILKRLGVVDKQREKQVTGEMVKSMGVRVADPATQTVASLSGGNQQKVVIGKWVAAEPNIFLVDEPTRGVDVGAKYEIYKLLLQFAKQGAGVLFVSSEMEELMGVCDRIVVMKDGQISGSVDKVDYQPESIMTLAL